MKRIIVSIFLLFIFFINLKAVSTNEVSQNNLNHQQKTTLSLSEEEKDWIKNNPVIKLAIMNYWPHDSNGNSLHTEILKLINEYTGTNIIPVRFDKWKDGFKQAVSADKIHGIMGLSYSKQRADEHFYYSQVYDYTPAYLIVRKDNKNINSIKDLKNKNVYLKSKAITHKIIAQKVQNANVIGLPDIQTIYEKLSSTNEADAMLAYFIDKSRLEEYNLKIVEIVYDRFGEVSIGTNHKYPHLASIINKAFNLIPKDQLVHLREDIFDEIKLKSSIYSIQDLDWIKQHPIINVGIQKDFVPFNFIDEVGNYIGISRDYLDIIERISGLKFKYHTAKDEKELIGLIKNERIDLIPAINFEKDKEKYLNFTVSYITLVNYFFTKKDYPKIDNLAHLEGKTISLVKGNKLIEWIKENYPKINIIQRDSIISCLELVRSNKSVAFIGDNPSTTYNLEKYFIKDIVLNTYIKQDKYPELYMATKKEYEPLAKIISKTINDIEKKEKNYISSKWMSSLEKEKIPFTKKEQKWLNKRQVVKYVYDPDWAPYEWKNEFDQHTGITSDILKIISDKTDIQFEAVNTNSWSESMQAVRDKKAIMYSAVSKNEQRQKYMDFTDTILYKVPCVLVSKVSDNNIYLDLAISLDNKKVAVVRNTALHDYIKTTYPDIKLSLVDSNIEGFTKLDRDNVDVFLLNASTAEYFIKSRGFKNIKISTKIDFDYELRVALSKDAPKELFSILNKTIETITLKNLSDVYHKWTNYIVAEKTNWKLIFEIVGVISLLTFFLIYSNRKLKNTVELKTADIKKKNKELEILMTSFDKNVIFTRTDLDGIITYASEAFCKISGYSVDELIGQPHSIIRHPDTPNELFKQMWESITNGLSWDGEMKNKTKNGGFFWVQTHLEPDYDSEYNVIGYSALRNDITNKKAFEDLSKNLEKKVEDRTKDLEIQKKQVEIILDNILLPILITSKKERKILYANRYAERQYDTSVEKLIGSSIDCIYQVKNQKDEILNELREKGYVENLEQHYKTFSNKEFIGLLSVKPITYKQEDAFIGMVTDITRQKEIEKEIRRIHKQTKDSIEYASLIQQSLIPQERFLKDYFSEYFTILEPKDIVGGDIYLFEEVREGEALIMVIDCTGHGVAGAFVTMLVKAIERQIVGRINRDEELVSPAKILSIFNRSMKHLLKQESIDSISNAGFDGQVIYYNKKDKIVKFASARNELFYIQNNNLEVIKGDRHSVGYKDSKSDYQFTEHIIDVSKETTMYISTDGYWDQIGEQTQRSFGKRRFKAMIEDIKNEPMIDQKNKFIDTLKKYQGNMDRQDDITVLAIKL